ncbi:MAG: single-stranded-DNA-specific exonuclease RecJ [Lachnospiraceae bacterium]|nr:single-stranded-DNA-specific exonuclease RecJ [Lachnospiraceae bacterium]
MENWTIYAKRADFNAWAQALGVDPVIARLIRNRDVETLEEARSFLRGTMRECHSPWLLKDMEKAVEGLMEAVDQGKKIRVIGDYDVDGICASYILRKGISILGGSVDVAIPHRIHDGYGLNENLIREAARDGVNFIVTCDNGIAAVPQIELARELGMDVMVTDHHEVPYVEENGVRREILPEALAVVDPKRGDDTYPFPGICGGVVAYKLMQAVQERMEENGDDRAVTLKDAMEELTEFAAFSTVCDIMELKNENRIIVREGLRRMRSSRNLGLRALMEVNGIESNAISAYHLGFVLGPCLNATGRLDTAQRALELLTSTTEVEAVNAARSLKELNDSRKNLTIQGVEEAIRIIAQEHLEEDLVLVVYLPDVHESLAGIIAGRVREQYGRPAFVLTRGEEGAKGSGRSVEKYNMYESLTEVKGLLSKFGGHKMAAGLSLPEENIAKFRRELNANCKLTQEDLIPCLRIDVPMPMDYASKELAREIDSLEPFGVGNPKPLFAQKDVIFCECKRMGKNGQFGKFRVRTPEGKKLDVTYFGDLEAFLAWLDEKFGSGSRELLLAGQGQYRVSVAYQIGINSYHGNEELQFLMKSFQ